MPMFDDDEIYNFRILGGIAIIGGGVAFAVSRYHVARPDEILVRVGLGISEMQFKRTCIRWPLQQVIQMPIASRQVRVNVPGHTKDMIKAASPVTLTWRPNPTKFKDYATSNLDKTPAQVDVLLSNQAIGLLRQQLAILHSMDVYSNREALREALESGTRDVFGKWGIEVESAVVDTVWDYDDAPDNEKVFANLSRRAIEQSHTNARISTVVANAEATLTES